MKAEPEQKINFVETGLTELIIHVPHLSFRNAQLIALEMRYALINCAKLHELDTFVVTQIAEYEEVARWRRRNNAKVYENMHKGGKWRWY